MPQLSQKTARAPLPKALWWGLGWLAVLGLTVGLVYYWRVFYYFDRMPALTITLGACAASSVLYGLAFVGAHFVHSYHARAALCIFACGVLFCFANPPFQAPDENVHFLRSYSVSQGHFDFDYARTYPDDVARLLEAFPGAWVGAHTSQGMGKNDNGETVAYSTEGYGLKQRGEGAPVESAADSFKAYFAAMEENTPVKPVHEPIVVMFLPFLPQALGILLARLLGFSALGCLYGARLANLAAYTVLCWLALKNCRRYQPVFLAIMLLPLSLFMAASVSYDAMLLGFYYLVASYYCKDEITDKDVGLFLFAFVMMNSAKPYLNLLWLALPLILPRKAWKTRWK